MGCWLWFIYSQYFDFITLRDLQTSYLFLFQDCKGISHFSLINDYGLIDLKIHRKNLVKWKNVYVHYSIVLSSMNPPKEHYYFLSINLFFSTHIAFLVWLSSTRSVHTWPTVGTQPYVFSCPFKGDDISYDIPLYYCSWSAFGTGVYRARPYLLV